jgi:hypothetical protein
MLATENKRRDAAEHDDRYDEVYMAHKKEDGTFEEKRIDRVYIPAQFSLGSLLNFLPGFPRPHRRSKSRIQICLVKRFLAPWGWNILI